MTYPLDSHHPRAGKNKPRQSKGMTCPKGSNATRTGRTLRRKAVLLTDGHEVVLEEIPDWNVVELIVNGENVFQCNIKALDFGGDGLLDPLCKEARIAVLNAY
ncbi:UPF0728 protein C10orf53 homolog isoform X2 [Rhinatrema bivittatum]|uniref:UPF0728 protein C10orf53 homolog isoform X2 n=1 Tax=Rhinatrema bivittatum TaxID=194408 RepID=UPI0011279845|nr:UPF0728 protein C10orf53 homolog isoform X2 [Rhinatrema bivittatum]